MGKEKKNLDYKLNLTTISEGNCICNDYVTFQVIVMSLYQQFSIRTFAKVAGKGCFDDSVQSCATQVGLSCCAAAVV